MEFGRDQCFRYLVCATKNSLFAWDVITQGLVWKVSQLHSPVRCLVPDPKSSYMAAILANREGNLQLQLSDNRMTISIIFVSNTVFIFSPSSSKPVYTIAKMNSSEPVAAVFIPRPNPLAKGPEWLVNSRLLIVDDKQVRSLVFLTFKFN